MLLNPMKSIRNGNGQQFSSPAQNLQSKQIAKINSQLTGQKIGYEAPGVSLVEENPTPEPDISGPIVCWKCKKMIR